MKIVRLELSNNYMSSNCYLLVKNQEVIIIDPGFEDNKLYNYLKDQNLKVDKIVLTHGHYDHWTGLEHLLKLYPNTLVYASSLDEYYLKNNPFTKYLPKVNVDLDELASIDFFDNKFQIIKTPGHSLGSISFYNDEILFSGDVLFYQSIGRSDLFGGNFFVLKESLKTLMKLPNNTTVYSGHGRPTTIKHEKKYNPFL